MMSSTSIYLVVNNFGHLGAAFTETDVERADLETTTNDLMPGQYGDPLRFVAFNTAEHFAERHGPNHVRPDGRDASISRKRDRHRTGKR
jgi:hypothetical protein